MRLFIGIGMMVGVAASAACTQVRNADDTVTGGGSSSSGSGGMSGPMTAGTTGTGSADTTGGQVDSGSGTAAGSTGNGMCEGTMEPAGLIPRPADVLVLFSNADTMDAEAALVTTAFNDFFNAIDPVLQPQLALLSSYPAEGPAGMCIDGPLGSGGCPTNDDNPRKFIHLDTPLDGTTALVTLADQHDNWASIQRDGAVTNIVVIADNDSDESVMDFVPLFSPLVGDWVVHASVPAQAPVAACNTGGACCNVAQEDAPAYRYHANHSGGVLDDMCFQDFAGFFDKVAMRMLEVSGDKCRWPFPDADPDQVNLLLEIDGGAQLLFGRATDLGSCDPVVSGWAYDDPSNPTEVVLCPATCDSVKTADSVVATFQLGCPTVEL